ncbi:uncharacterized protein LOC130124400 [Lampris incognitus]|uniref:uncharacterized protein LOC130124400 n=1 Tax=Lampris incognitus TaxID=2546036 RepID=UPI0024B564B9|nr:uncharacterized protein LOC130124400 [Lampris incognitus]
MSDTAPQRRKMAKHRADKALSKTRANLGVTFTRWRALVLKRLLQHYLIVKLEKCEFHATTVSFLGSILSPSGMSVDPEKVRAVSEWVQPKSVRQIKQFMGFANFYRRFIRGFSTIAALINDTTKKSSSPFRWTPQADRAFARLKHCLTSSPVTVHADSALPLL